MLRAESKREREGDRQNSKQKLAKALNAMKSHEALYWHRATIETKSK